MAHGNHEGGAWRPTGITPLIAPSDRPVEDLRWRPAREPEEPVQDQRERSRRAIAEQCLNSRMPGYTGFIPSARAEDVYGRTQAAVGRTAVEERVRRHSSRAAPPTPEQPCLRNIVSGPPAPEDHPLGKSRANMVRNHWVPTIPGYGGYVPGKHAENICGGGIIHTCKMAGRAIAERAGQALPEPLPPVTMKDELSRSRIMEFYHGQNLAVGGTEKDKLAHDIREHCAKQIPGYMGFVPRIKGDSIFGATARQANLVAADLCEDRIYNPEDHARSSCAPQVAPPRRLRV